MGTRMEHLCCNLLLCVYRLYIARKKKALHIDGSNLVTTIYAMFGALSRLIIIHISCDSAEKEKEANITSIQLNDSAVFDNKSHSVK